MESNKMDNIGFHIISCEILRASFNNKDVYTANEKCFNGRRLTELQMGHIMKLQKFWKLHDRKFVTFSEFNLNHNPSYSSIKHIDGALTEYLSEVSVILVETCIFRTSNCNSFIKNFYTKKLH